MKVLHLPTSVGGNPHGLSVALRKLGVTSTTLTVSQNVFEYPSDRFIAHEGDNLIVRIFKQVLAVKYVFGNYDIIHFNFGSTLFSHRFLGVGFSPVGLVKWGLNLVIGLFQRFELAVLKWRRIPMFVHYQGDDARQGIYSMEHYKVSIAAEVSDGYYTAESDRNKQRQINLLEKYCVKMYAVNPDLLDVLPENCEFIPYGHVDLSELTLTQKSLKHTIRIAHAPSNRKVKGTEHILDSLKALEAEGLKFELVLVEGVSNPKALDIYRSCDVVIDQIFAGWYGGLAVECMALGKPVASYIRDQDLRHIPQEMKRDLPIIQINKSSLTDDLRRIITMDKEKLLKLSSLSRGFVEKWHDPSQIAGRILLDYKRALAEKKIQNGTHS